MKRYINKTYKILSLISLLLFSLAACKKITTELPGDSATDALNFYPATDVMPAAYGTAGTATTAIYVDTFQQNPKPFPYVTGSGSKIPAWGFNTNGGSEFPTVDGGFLNYVNFDHKPEGHRLFFTDTANISVLDTLIQPGADSYTCVYLADAPVTVQNKPAVYRMLSVTEDRAEVPSGKVGIRFIHLSPDAGSLSCNVIRANGSTSSIIPGNLEYMQSTSYQYLDTSAVSSGLIKFSLNNNENGAEVITGIPFTPGRSYVILITGFLNDQQRQVRSGTDPDGSAKYTSVSISKNLRAIIRKSY